MHTAFIAIGANLGERHRTCVRAIDCLRARPEIHVSHVASWREYPALTQSAGEVQPDFVNGVIRITTPIAPHALLATCHAIEHQLGRHRTGERWQPRPIDLDLLAFNDWRYADGGLRLPHPELHRRRFVLEPLAEIAPDWVHPALRKTAQALLEEVLCNSF